MSIAYFVQDVTDPAVARRLRLLELGGAEVALAGFRRAEAIPNGVAGALALDLGRTYDARLGHRAAKTVASLARIEAMAALARGRRLILARNLEMLLLGAAVRRRLGGRIGLAYEVLDIHGALLRRDGAGRALRGLEDRLRRPATRLVTSSPAFLREYFDQRPHPTPPLLVENRNLLETDAIPPPPPPPPLEGPWRIAWFGHLRCQRSLDLLDALTRRRPGAVKVELRGRPFQAGFRDFAAQTAANPDLEFLGPYAPADLPALYGGCHLVWGVDFYEEGLNSSWLLPNRLYEGGAAQRPIIALAGVEVGRWLAAHGAGVLLKDPEPDLEALVSGLSPARWSEFAAAAAAVPRSAFFYGPQDCRAIVETLLG